MFAPSHFIFSHFRTVIEFEVAIDNVVTQLADSTSFILVLRSANIL
jgi:hypothetical protein